MLKFLKMNKEVENNNDNDKDSDIVLLVSETGETHNLNKRVATLSNLVKHHISDFSVNEPVPLPEIANDTLILVVKFLNSQNPERLHEVEYPIKGDNLKDIIGEASEEVVNEHLSLEQLIDLINAANYMDIKVLMEAGCAAMAFRFEGKDEKDIFSAFQITSDITPFERQKILDENKWIDDNFNHS